MRKYEVMYIVKPMEEEATNAVIDKFSKLIAANGGNIVKTDLWGKRKLAYEIKDCTEGFYVLEYVESEPACMDELDRVFKITDDVLKHMVVKSEEADEAAAPAEEAEAAE